MPRKPVPRSVIRDGKMLANHTAKTIVANRLQSPLVKHVLHVQHQLTNGQATGFHKQNRNRWGPVYRNFEQRLKAGTMRLEDLENIQALIKSEFSRIKKPSASTRLHV
jgi:hypothetical protein